MKDYEGLRRDIYQPLQNVFDWAEMYGQEYALPHCHTATNAQCVEIRSAAVKLGNLIDKTVKIVARAEDELLRELGLPENAWSAVRVPSETSTLIGRFDFALTANGFKMLEFNADTPSGIVEAFFVNGEVCRYWQKQDPNAGLNDQIGKCFAKWRSQQGVRDFAKVVFSALDWHCEDLGNTKYLQRQYGKKASFLPLSDLRVAEDGVYGLFENGTLQRIDVLFRMHPLEVLSGDVSDDGFPVGAELLRHAAKRNLLLLNPPSALLAQTKFLQALIWSVYEQGGHYSADEETTIKKYMLPTYFENRFLGRCSYVAKPAFGREGKGVKIYDASGRLEAGSENEAYEKDGLIYQQKIELEKVSIETHSGGLLKRLLWGVFILGGEAGAILLRAGGQITDDMAYYLPVCLE